MISNKLREYMSVCMCHRCVCFSVDTLCRFGELDLNVIQMDFYMVYKMRLFKERRKSVESGNQGLVKL